MRTLAACGVAASIGCSGAAETNLFNGVSEGTDAGADAASHPAAFDASAPDVAAPPREDASAADTSAPPAPEDASAPDTSAPSDNPGIQCGNAYCKPGTDVCCRLDTALNPTFVCLPAVGCSAITSLAIPCDDEADCTESGTPGVCCVTENAQSGRAESVECVAADQCGSDLQTNMCNSPSNDPCPNGGSCKPSQTTIPGYAICI